MNRFIIIASAFLFAAVSCQKMGDTPGSDGEIILYVDDGAIAMESVTKATAVTSIPSTLYWGSTSGTRGNAAETRKYHNGSGSGTSGSVSSSKIATGKYQTATPTAYNHYVSNVNFSIPSTGNVTMSASNTTDVVCGWVAGSNSTSPSVTLNHIFARTGSLTLSVPSGYTASSVSWSIKSKGSITGTAGTYNLSTGAWTSSSATLGSTNISGSSDLYLLPGVYTVTSSFTLTRGNFSKSYSQSGDITIYAGKVNNITCTTNSAEAIQVVFTTSVTAWTSASSSFNWGP